VLALAVKHFPVVRILAAVQRFLTGSCAAFSQQSEATVVVAGACVDRVGSVELGAVGSVRANEGSPQPPRSRLLVHSLAGIGEAARAQGLD
jgi:hypothetical protein